MELTRVKPTFGIESFAEVREEIKPLLAAHWKEVAHYPDIELDVDWTRYAMLADAGLLRIFTVRSEDRKLVGYAIFMVQTNMHYKQSLQALQDVLFISPEHRGFGKKFIEWCDHCLRSEGVQAVYHHVKKEHNFGPMLERIGYELVDLIYGRRLDT